MKKLILLLAIALCVACGPKLVDREWISEPYQEQATQSCTKMGYCYYMGRWQTTVMCPGSRDGIATYQVERLYFEDDTYKDRVRRIDFEATGSCR
jgi:hypothetical protein